MRNLFILLAFLPFFTNAQICEPNMDFELGNYTSWHYYIGSCCPGGAINTPLQVTTMPTPSLIPCAFEITGAPGLTGIDRFGGFPVVGPGFHSMRIGSERTGWWAEKVEYSVHVPAGLNDYTLFYNYAVVMQDPSHPVNQQPRFVVTTKDSATGALIPCGNYSYVSGSLPGWVGPVGPIIGLPGACGSTATGPTPGSVYYKPWSIASINLTGYAGHTVIVSFAAGDCGAGGHFGYGYVEMTCGLFAINNFATCTSPTVQLAAPLGFASYAWFDSSTFTISYGTNDTIVIPTPAIPTTYAVIVTPFSGYGCVDTLFTTVYPPGMVTSGGSATICQGASTMLVSGSSGGTWSSDNTTVATVNSSSGFVTGMSAGTAVISYESTSCSYYTKTVTVLGAPAITGAPAICLGDTITLSTSAGGGVWSSANTNVATVSATGVVTSVTAGSTTISYTIGGGCAGTIAINVAAIPTAITGPNVLCLGTVTMLTCTPPGGVWSSSNSAIATIDPATGWISGVSSGITTITYTVGGACTVTMNVDVSTNVAPPPITGDLLLCVGETTTLSNSLVGGTWSSDNPGKASITTGPVGGGVVTAIAPGTAFIYHYNGCTSVEMITIEPNPTITAGETSICPGNTTTLSGSPSGGSWTSGNLAVATVSPTGTVGGVAVGSSTVTYTTATGCTNTQAITVIVCPTLGITGLPANDEVTIFPNPVKSTLTITCTKTISRLEITNLPGQVVYTNSYNTDYATVDLATLPKGVYILRINNTIVRRLLKE